MSSEARAGTGNRERGTVGAALASRRAWAVAVAALLLGGCALLGGEKEPVAIYAPIPDVVADPAWPAVDWQLGITKPHASGMIEGRRIAVRPVPGELQVYAGAMWASEPAEQLRDAVLRTLEDSGRIGAVARQESGIASDYRLETDVRHRPWFKAVSRHWRTTLIPPYESMQNSEACFTVCTPLLNGDGSVASVLGTNLVPPVIAFAEGFEAGVHGRRQVCPGRVDRDAARLRLADPLVAVDVGGHAADGGRRAACRPARLRRRRVLDCGGCHGDRGSRRNAQRQPHAHDPSDRGMRGGCGGRRRSQIRRTAPRRCRRSPRCNRGSRRPCCRGR